MSFRKLLSLIFFISPTIGTRIMVWWFSNAASPRPRRWSMAHSYISWTGLVDRRYSGRHLPEDPNWDERVRNGRWNGRRSRLDWLFGPRLNPDHAPDLETLRRLFLRNERPQHNCPRSSVFFLFFAQWFTDAFLRTDPNDFRKTDSNHEIDFCALYGLTEEKTHMLRVHLRKNGKVVMENGRPKLDPDREHLLATDNEEGLYPPRLYEEYKEGEETKLRYRASFRYSDSVVEEEDPKASPGAEPVARTHYLHPPLRMASITENQCVEDILPYFAMGLEHGNGTLGYVVLNTLMLRAHNKIAQEILDAHGEAWGDEAGERAFQTTRNVLTFILLKIVIEDYVSHISGFPLKALVGLSDGARWGKANRIALEFNLLYRWHALVPDQVHVNGKALTKDEFRRMPALVEEYGLETLLTAFSSQRAGRIALRNYPDFFGEPRAKEGNSTLERTLRTVHKAKFQTMNAYRRHFRLKPIFSFSQLVGDQPDATILKEELAEIYGSVHDVEWFIGMLAEDHAEGVIMGALMRNMVAYDAFTQALNNPLLSKRMFDRKLGGPEPVFSAAGLELIERVSTFQELSDYVLGPGAAHCSFSV